MRLQDKYFLDDNGIISPIGAGALYALSDGVDVNPLLDYYGERIHFVRTFAGRLTPSDTRTGQSPEEALDRLPGLLENLRNRGRRIEITCCTDTAGEPYDEREHCRAIANIARFYRETVQMIEVWNEIGHSTQRAISHGELLELKNVIREHYDGPVSLGASNIDELDPQTGRYPSAYTGPNSQANMHLNRGKKPSYREAFRVKEFYDVRNKHNCGACNNEPGRFDSPELNEPDGQGAERFAYLLGCLGMSFGYASIAHSSAMRDCRVPTDVEDRAFNAYLRGAKAIPRGQYQWLNANNTNAWPSSPVKTGSFAEGPANDNNKALWRAYSYLGPKQFVIASGENPDLFNIEFQNNYRQIGIIDDIFKVVIFEIAQG